MGNKNERERSKFKSLFSKLEKETSTVDKDLYKIVNPGN